MWIICLPLETPESKRLKQEKKNEKKEKNKKLNQIKQEKNNKRKFDQAYFEEKKAKQEALDSVQKKNENEGSNKKGLTHFPLPFVFFLLISVWALLMIIARLESPEDELVKNLEFGSFGAKDAKKSTKSHTLKPDKKKPKLNKAQLLQQVCFYSLARFVNIYDSKEFLILINFNFNFNFLGDRKQSDCGAT